LKNLSKFCIENQNRVKSDLKTKRLFHQKKRSTSDIQLSFTFKVRS